MANRARKPTPTASRPRTWSNRRPTLPEILRRIGPGMILAAAIVGSGELIATTTLGAQEGYGLLWLILLSCLVKPIIQAELGRYTIATGEPTLESLGRVPGPRLGGARAKLGWVSWGWAVMVFMTLLQVGAMFGGLAPGDAPAVAVGAGARLGAGLFLAITLALLLGGGYERIERLAVVKVGLFTLLTLLAAVLLTRRPDFSWSAVAHGLTLATAQRRPVHGGGGVRRHRRRHQRAGDVSLPGAWRRATPDSPARATAARPGSGAPAAGSGSCTSTSWSR